MADFEYGVAVDAGEPARGGEFVTLMNWLGALISVALIAGLAFWGYQLWVRDVSGVPVVQALEGPMRIAPDDPGGENADHQGLAVNRIAAKGQAAAPADRLVLAPAPLQLSQEDQTAGEITAANAQADSIRDQPADALATDLAVAEALTSAAEADEPLVQDQSDLVTTTMQLAQITAQGEAASPLPKPELSELARTGIPDGAIAPDIAGVSRSVRPVARPATRVATIAAGAETPAGSVASADPASIPLGTRLAQLGAFDSPEVAKAEWVKIAKQFEDVMGDKVRVIQKAQSGGKSFYRLRAMGFENISDARRFCSMLLAGKAACIPVITR